MNCFCMEGKNIGPGLLRLAPLFISVVNPPARRSTSRSLRIPIGGFGRFPQRFTYLIGNKSIPAVIGGKQRCVKKLGVGDPFNF